jgi:hypothetical protein
MSICARSSAAPRHPADEERRDVLDRRQAGHQVEGLEDDPDRRPPVRRQLGAAQRGDLGGLIATPEHDRTARGREDRREGGQHVVFPQPLAPSEDELALCDVEVQVVDGPPQPPLEYSTPRSRTATDTVVWGAAAAVITHLRTPGPGRREIRRPPAALAIRPTTTATTTSLTYALTGISTGKETAARAAGPARRR